MVIGVPDSRRHGVNAQEQTSEGGLTLVRARTIRIRAGWWADAIVVHSGVIVAAGSARELAERFEIDQTIELSGIVFPGFNDAHSHPVMAAENLLRLDCSADRVKNRGELRDALQRSARMLGPGDWVVGTRFDPTRSEPGMGLDRHFLDDCVSDRPVLVIHVSGHWGVLNSAGLAAAGLDDSSVEPPGGRLGRDERGRLNGVVHEQALFDVAYPAVARGGRAVIPAASLTHRMAALKQVVHAFNAAGITSVCDALCGPGDLALLQALKGQGAMSMRFNVLLAYQYLDEIEKIGLRSGFGDTRLRILGIKTFLDGACAGGTCWVDEPFAGTDSHGIQTMPAEEIEQLLQRANDAGIVVAAHANGDRAIRLLLEAHENVGQRDTAIRHRIEHCSLVDRDILGRMKRLGLVAVPFGSYPRFHGERLIQYYGRDRLERMFAHRSFIDHGIPVAGSSDHPCGPFEPLYSIASCVERLSVERVEIGVSQRLTVAESIDLYTTGSAYSTGEEGVKGTLAPGMLADFTELAEDPFAVDPSRIADIAVLSTWVGGEQVYAASDASAP